MSSKGKGGIVSSKGKGKGVGSGGTHIDRTSVLRAVQLDC